eukprot:9076513-Ditylum_brightwellii.AAC.1
MVSQLESEPRWKKIEENANVVKQQTMIKDITYKYESQSYTFKAVHNTVRGFYLKYQKDNITLK